MLSGCFTADGPDSLVRVNDVMRNQDCIKILKENRSKKTCPWAALDLQTRQMCEIYSVEELVNRKQYQDVESRPESHQESVEGTVVMARKLSNIHYLNAIVKDKQS